MSIIQCATSVTRRSWCSNRSCWRVVEAPLLTDSTALSARWRSTPAAVVAGDALLAFADSLDTGQALRRPHAQVTAEALVALAEAAWRDGAGVDAAEALPLYVRDKVAETTREREAAKR